MNSDQILQKITRTDSDGCDRIVGIFRCDLAAGQTSYVLNVPIHPPMENAPEVEAVIIQGAARTRITNREKFGVRIEVTIREAVDTASQVYLEAIIVSDSPE